MAHMPAAIELTEELTQQICELLTTMPMSDICKMPYMPSNATVHKWYALYPDFHQRCRRARDLCADKLFDEHKQIVQRVIDGEMESDNARVALNGLQWQIMQLDRARYGDKPTKVSITNNSDNRRVDVTIEALRLGSPEVIENVKNQIISAHQTPDKQSVDSGAD